MADLLDIVAYFDPINRIEGAVSTFLNADWRGAYTRRGALGVVAEFVACVTNHNSPTIYISRYQSWRGIDVERLLKRNGVKLWDRGLAGDELYFCVKRRQARWAEYILKRAGVSCRCDMSDPRNSDWGAQFAPGDEPRTFSALNF
jgi:hypothetical protein